MRGVKLGSSAEIVAFLGQGARFNGTLEFRGCVRVEGELEGEVITEGHLIVAPTAQINAELHVATITVEGTVRGAIHASETVELKSTGKVYGDIYTPSLTIEDGVLFDGSCHMESGRSKVHSPKQSLRGARKEPAASSNQEPDQETGSDADSSS